MLSHNEIARLCRVALRTTHANPNEYDWEIYHFAQGWNGSDADLEHYVPVWARLVIPGVPIPLRELNRRVEQGKAIEEDAYGRIRTKMREE